MGNFIVYVVLMLSVFAGGSAVDKTVNPHFAQAIAYLQAAEIIANNLHEESVGKSISAHLSQFIETLKTCYRNQDTQKILDECELFSENLDEILSECSVLRSQICDYVLLAVKELEQIK